MRRALVSADFPFGPLQEGTDSAVRAAIRFVKEAGVDMVKVDAASDFPDAVTAITPRASRCSPIRSPRRRPAVRSGVQRHSLECDQCRWR